MTSILKKSVFVHIPKTGGTCVSRILESHQKRESYTKHLNTDEIIKVHPDLEKRPFFAFVRNPVTWWQSRWSCNFNRYFFLERQGLKFDKKFKIVEPRHKWLLRPKVSELLRKTRILTQEEYDDFNVWIKRIVTEHPDWLSKYYKHYLGDNYEKIDYIGKYENLISDLSGILVSIGEDFKQPSEDVRANESNNSLNRTWDRDLLRKVIRANREFMIRFGYSVFVDDYELGVIWR